MLHKHLRPVTKHTLMNKFSYVNTKHHHNYSFDFQIPKLTSNAHHTHLVYVINTKKDVPVDLKILYCI